MSCQSPGTSSIDCRHRKSCISAQRLPPMLINSKPLSFNIIRSSSGSSSTSGKGNGLDPKGAELAETRRSVLTGRGIYFRPPGSPRRPIHGQTNDSRHFSWSRVDSLGIRPLPGKGKGLVFLCGIVVPSGLNNWLLDPRIFGISPTSVWIFFCFLGAPWGPEWAQNVGQKTSFRTPKYRPNPANGGPIGGKKPFWKNIRATPLLAKSLLRGPDLRQITVYGMLHTNFDNSRDFPGMISQVFGLSGSPAGPGMAINVCLGSGGSRSIEYHQNPGSGKPFRGHFSF